MRILFISTFYPPHVVGGWEQLVEDLNTGLRQRGHETLVLTTTHGLPHNKPVVDVKAGVDRSLLLESRLQFYQPSDMLFYRRRTQHNLEATRAAIQRFQPDVVFVHIMWNLSRAIPWLAEQLVPGRVVYYVADHWPYSPDTHEAYWQDCAGDRLRQALKRIVAPLPLHIVAQDRSRFRLAFDNVLCVSEAIRQSMLDSLHLDPQKVQVVYNGIDVAAFPYRRRLVGGDGGEETATLRLLYAGSLVPHKGVHVAVDAMRELARQNSLGSMRLTIVGSGRPDYEARLHQAVVDYGLQACVHFAGRVARSEMPAQLAAHDVLIFPSEWPEPLARMTQEAMASGAVVVGTVTGGTGEILVEGETGLVFAPGNASALASCICRLAADPALFDRLATNARRRVEEKFSFKRMLDQVEDILHKVVMRAKAGLATG
jgi:glycogen synthase